MFDDQEARAYRDGRLEHEMLGSPALIRRIDGRTSGGRSRAAALGRALVEPASAPAEVRRNVTSQGMPSIDGATLVSWLLLPKAWVGQGA